MPGVEFAVEFLESISGWLTVYYAALALMNGVAAIWWWRANDCVRNPGLASWVRPEYIWILLTAGFSVMGAVAWCGGAGHLAIPRFARSLIDRSVGPVAFCALWLGGLIAAFVFRRVLVRPAVAWSLLNLALLWMGLSLTDPDCHATITKPDNVAIVAAIFLLGFFTWLSAYRAGRNDRRKERGEPSIEERDDDNILVWPDLVYIELICMLLLATLLIVWALVLRAPLESPASPVITPNPSKAPWYFVGLQEMLGYYDPWMAGVVLPTLIIFGLMAIPYLDRNGRGRGYYSIEERKFAYFVFQFGFLGLWMLLIVIGTFFRGPNWTFFGPYETWDVYKVDSQSNVNVSHLFWVEWLGRGLPQAPDGVTGYRKLFWIAWRESPGLLLLAVYFGCVPRALRTFSRFFRRMYDDVGYGRFMVLSYLLLAMGLLPLKMIACWVGDVRYFVAMPEYFLSF